MTGAETVLFAVMVSGGVYWCVTSYFRGRVDDLEWERDLLSKRLLEHGEEMTFEHRADGHGGRVHTAYLRPLDDSLTSPSPSSRSSPSASRRTSPWRRG